MQIGVRRYEHEVVEWFRRSAASPDYTRARLARELCERTDWRNVKGELCEAQARKALPKLARELRVKLPEPSSRRPPAAKLRDYEAAPRLLCSLAEIGEVTVTPVSAAEAGEWLSMMETHHPRGAPRLPGAAIKYWVRSERFGRVGGLSFHAASWRQSARDAFIGWSARARTANIGLVVNNARFLILPSVRVHGLASRALELGAARLCEDWREAYGVSPALAYTYIDARHRGVCYQAARWRRLGQTSGRNAADGMPKQVYGMPLRDGWREELCAAPAARFAERRDVYLREDAHWTDMEYGYSTHPDGRVRQRILSMGRDWGAAPEGPTPQTFASEAKQKAAYRLISSDNVSMDDILESHRQATVSRGALHSVVLAVQDTTALNYDTLKNSAEGLVTIGGTAKGVMAHACVAFSEGGRPLGVLDVDGQFRHRFAEDAERAESWRWVEGLATAAEYSEACGAGTRVIGVCDREADLWELFELQARRREQVGLLVRCNGARRRKVLDAGGRKVDLRAHVEAAAPVARRAIKIEAQGGKRARKAREAHLTLRALKVSVKAPGKGDDTLELTAVSVIEESPPENAAPLNWLLLTSEGEADAETAVSVCRWYEARWGIEEYFRVLKSGCRIEKRRFSSEERLLKCMAFDAITAWRAFDLHRIAKHEPQRPSDEVIEPEEFHALYVMLHDINPKRHGLRPPPGQVMEDYIVDLGRVAGFRPTRRQPLPGMVIVWRATAKLMTAIQVIKAYKAYKASEQAEFEDP